jgi:hypothetical protein
VRGGCHGRRARCGKSTDETGDLIRIERREGRLHGRRRRGCTRTRCRQVEQRDGELRGAQTSCICHRQGGRLLRLGRGGWLAAREEELGASRVLTLQLDASLNAVSRMVARRDAVKAGRRPPGDGRTGWGVAVRGGRFVFDRLIGVPQGAGDVLAFVVVLAAEA